MTLLFMKLSTKLLAVVFLASALLIQNCHKEESGHEEHKKHWSYTGDTGPSQWGHLEEKFEACSTGSRQSPIDILPPYEKSKESLVLNYSTSPLKMINNGHSIQVNITGEHTLKVANKNYHLVQFHFHTPSEHTVDGKHIDMEIHLVHKADDGSFAVVGVLLNKGKENQFLSTIWNKLPKEEGKETEDATIQLVLKDLLPKKMGYYHYTGSLTTPPCSEGVEWYVLAEPMEASTQQMLAFQSIFPVSIRPLQPLNGRKIVKGG
jgi:carbonic anhydrase